MILRRVVASLVIGVMVFSNAETVLAIDAAGSEGTNNSEIVSELVGDRDVDKLITTGVEDLSVQLDDLYKEIGRNLNIDYVYVKIMHLIAGGKAVYADKRPNIYAELTVNSVDAPFDIEGAKQTYSARAPWVDMPDETVVRPSKYYLPDAAYSTAADVVKIMNSRYYADRGQLKPYFDALNTDVKTTIIFCEAMLEYTGASPEAVESFYSTYEKMLYEKDKYENIIESHVNSTYTIKDKFKDILISNHISTENNLRVLSIILSFDSNLAASSSPNDIKDEYVMPYKLNYTSRENMMIAAMSVVGKVRYIWGGGHLGTGTIDGINPSWKEFFNSYPRKDNFNSEDDQTDSIGYDMCIQPTASWCPIHGLVENENGCLFMANTVYSVEEYVDSWKEIIDTSSLEEEKYKSLLERSIDFKHGVNSHRLDGLDCSGYASWLYNQISSDKNYDSSARYFIESSGLQNITYGDEMLPGDVFSWGSHIVVTVGKSNVNSDAYVMIESSPNMVKFGVIYYGSKAKKSDIELAVSIAKEANELIGNLPLTERTNIYNMDSCGYQEDNEGNITGRYAEIGRLSNSFLDENIIIEAYNKKIKEMTAKEIIQYTIDNLTPEYMSGLPDYSGEIFNTSGVVGANIDSNVIKNNILLSETSEATKESDVIPLTTELTGEDNEEKKE